MVTVAKEKVNFKMAGGPRWSGQMGFGEPVRHSAKRFVGVGKSRLPTPL